MTPKVSIIVPNYNYARYLPKRLDSILNQTFKDYELIFMDDASTDNSLEIFEKYRNKVSEASFNKKNSGSVFKQWQKGVQMAKGEYIWIAEADDYSDEKFLERTVEILDKYSEVGLVYTQSTIVTSNDQLDKVSYKNYFNSVESGRWDNDFKEVGVVEGALYLSIFNTIPNVSAVLFRANLLKKAGVISFASKLTGDWLTYCNILRNSDLYFISDFLNYHRFHEKTVRELTLKNGVYIYDFLKTKRYVFKLFNVPTNKKEKSLENFLAEWKRVVDMGNVPFTVNVKIVLYLLFMFDLMSVVFVCKSVLRYLLNKTRRKNV